MRVEVATPQTGWGAGILVMRTEGDPMPFANPIRAQVQAIDRDLPVTAIRTMDDVVRRIRGDANIEQPAFSRQRHRSGDVRRCGVAIRDCGAGGQLHSGAARYALGSD